MGCIFTCFTLQSRSRCPGRPFSVISNSETDECSMQYEHIISLPVYPRVSVSLCWVFLDVLCISYIFGWKSKRRCWKGFIWPVTVIPHQKSIGYFEANSDLKWTGTLHSVSSAPQSELSQIDSVMNYASTFHTVQPNSKLQNWVFLSSVCHT